MLTRGCRLFVWMPRQRATSLLVLLSIRRSRICFCLPVNRVVSTHGVRWWHADNPPPYPYHCANAYANRSSRSTSSTRTASSALSSPRKWLPPMRRRRTTAPRGTAAAATTRSMTRTRCGIRTCSRRRTRLQAPSRQRPHGRAPAGPQAAPRKPRPGFYGARALRRRPR